MPTPEEIPFRQMLDALLDEGKTLNPRYLYRLSDLNSAELNELEAIWAQIGDLRRRALMEDLEILSDNDYLLSFEAIARLGLKDSNPLVRTAAVRILWDCEDQDLAWIYMDMAESDQDQKVRAAAASALGRFVYLAEVDELPENIELEIEKRLLCIAKGQDDELLRQKSLEALGYSSLEEVARLIQEAYDSGKRDWIASSLFAMGRSANEMWRNQILSKILNPHPVIRMEAARAAGELELSEATSDLFELLKDDNVDVRSAAIWSLSQIGGPGVRSVLEEMHEQTDDDEEAEFLITALDNLDFTEEMAMFTMFDIDGSPKPVPEVDLGKKPDLADAYMMLDEDDLDEEDSFFSDDDGLEDFEDDLD
jgi:HEAT repeat protein